MRRTTRHEDDALWDWNLTSNRIHYSGSWLASIGLHDHELGTAPDEWLARVHPDDVEQLRAALAAVRTAIDTEVDVSYRLRHKDGTYRWMQCCMLAVRAAGGEAVRLTGTQHDVTVDTVTDPATGLPNHLLLVDRLTQSIDRARRHPSFSFALLVVEVGRPPGPQPAVRAPSDPLLNSVARRLETCLRMPAGQPEQRERDLVARVEGDRLAVLLDGMVDLQHARSVGECIRSEMTGAFRIGGREIRLSPAIGLTLSASGYERAGDALRDAQTAAHRARVLGGSHCELFDAQVLQARETALQLERDLDLALQRGEIELRYQPIVSMTAGTPIGFEALVRWRHPSLGLISPVDFIPIAERSGAIVPLGRWILQEACRQLRAWESGPATAAGVWMSVNVSGVQLRDSHFAEQVTEVLRDSGLDPRRLVLELTEGVAMHDPAAVRTLLMRLRADGVRVSIDDFGTGYSSLAYLRQLPVDGVKVDQSFVRRLAEDHDAVVIVSAILTMAKDLSLSVVAEGVETEMQRARLEEMGCAAAQGYLFAEPLVPAEALLFLQEGTPGAVSTGGTAGGVTATAPVSRPRAPVPVRVARGTVAAGAIAIVVGCMGIGALLYRSHPSTAAHVPVPVESAPAAGTAPAITVAVEEAKTPSPGAGAEAPPPAAGAGAPEADRQAQTFQVVHLHRLGECRGRLIVSQRRVAFTADEGAGDDAFSWKANAFTHTADRNTVTVRAGGRTYRFESGVERVTARPPQIARISKALAEVRP